MVQTIRVGVWNAGLVLAGRRGSERWPIERLIPYANSLRLHSRGRPRQSPPSSSGEERSRCRPTNGKSHVEARRQAAPQ
jgi:hypothetical protein